MDGTTLTISPPSTMLGLNVSTSVTITDGYNLASYDFTIEIINLPPYFQTSVIPFTILVGTNYNLPLPTSIDPESVPTKITIDLLPSYLSLSGSIITAVPGYNLPSSNTTYAVSLSDTA